VDWKMPGMDGIDLAKHIKTQDGDNSIIIMISSSEWGEIKEQAGAVGVNKFLPKPLFPSSIADLINECLSKDAIHASMVDAKGKNVISFMGRRLLIAEDVEINREIILTLLAPTNLDMKCAENGAEAVRMFRESPASYDMIFMDVQMPEMDGYEATRQIRAMDGPYGRQVPIVAMTANVFKEDVERCIESGMNAHLGKPIDFDEVMKILKQYLLYQHQNRETE
jgi:CheY-like chemotaxis protein